LEDTSLRWARGWKPGLFYLLDTPADDVASMHPVPVRIALDIASEVEEFAYLLFIVKYAYDDEDET
jgi:hypothetical protein